MLEPLIVAVAQPLCVSHDVAVNAATHAAAVRAAGAGVVVFPELSLTGYELDAAVVDPGDRRLAPIVKACAETGSVALVGAPVAGPHIAMLAVDGSGVRVAYRKMWLGGPEPDRFTPGDKPAVLEVAGRRLGLAICKDVNEPRHAADTAALGIDCYVAGVAKTVAEAPALHARASRIAVEHGVWVAIASFAGDTGGGFAPAAGHSGIWSPGGGMVASAGLEPGAITRATM